MVSKRQRIAVWFGGTEIPAASNLSIKTALAPQAAHLEDDAGAEPARRESCASAPTETRQGFSDRPVIGRPGHRVLVVGSVRNLNLLAAFTKSVHRKPNQLGSYVNIAMYPVH